MYLFYILQQYRLTCTTLHHGPHPTGLLWCSLKMCIPLVHWWVTVRFTQVEPEVLLSCVCVLGSGLQHPGPKLWFVAFPAILHLRSPLRGIQLYCVYRYYIAVHDAVKGSVLYFLLALSGQQSLTGFHKRHLCCTDSDILLFYFLLTNVLYRKSLLTKVSAKCP